MAYNGSGTFLINTAGQPVVAGTVISSTTFNALTADLATGLSTVITKDGQTTVTANIPMASFKFTGLGVGSAAGDSANLSQVQSTVTKLLASVSGADTVTATASPTLAAYAAGQMFYFVAAGDNTTSVTLNIDALGAKAVTRDGSVALAAADIKSGEVVVVVYDGTRFQVVSQLNSAGNATFANVSITSALNVGGIATFSAGSAAAPSITTTGDTNTGLFFPAADTIAFTEGGVEAMRIDSSGQVGIGTASPGSKLEVNGEVRIYPSSSPAQLRFGVSAVEKGKLAVDTSSNMIFETANSERMRLDASGNLGIGTASPAARLDVVTSGPGLATFTRDLATDVSFNISADNDGTICSTGGVHNMRFFTNSAERCRITSGGDLLVGTTSAVSSAKVTISANSSSSTDASYLTLYGVGENIGDINYTNAFGIMARLRGTKAGSGGNADEGYFEVATASNGTLTGGVYITSGGTSWTAVSDERKKTDLVPIEQACEKVLTLRAVTGRYLDDKLERRRAFLIAQDVQAVLPEAVSESTNNDESVLGLAYTDTIPLLVAAIKELSAKVAALESK